jgi:ribosomal protein S18 acetylase RimI-like enzyme
LKLIKSTSSNNLLINELLNLSNNDNEMGYAYPRGDIEDVENELKEYGVNINDCFYIIKEEADIIGIVGLLEIEDDKAIIIGPVMYKTYYVFQKVNEIIKKLLLNIDAKYNRISCDILKENIILTSVLEHNNFKLTSSNVTMKIHLNEELIKSNNNFESIILVNPQDRNILIEIDNLFHSTLSDWKYECIDSLYEYLDEGYKIAIVKEKKLVIGSIIWIWFEELGYGRIEYIATQITHQQKGYGGLMIDYVLSELSKVLNYNLHNYFYLDLNIENETAYKLYNKKGFEVQYQDYVYRVNLK